MEWDYEWPHAPHQEARAVPYGTAWKRHGQKCSMEQLPCGRWMRWGWRRQKKKRKNQKWGWCGGIKRWWGSEPGRTMGLKRLEGLGRQIRGLLHRLLWCYPSEKSLIANKRPCLGTRTSVRLLLLAWDSVVKRNVVSEKQILTYTQSLLFMRFFSSVLSVITGVLESIHYSYVRLCFCFSDY